MSSKNKPLVSLTLLSVACLAILPMPLSAANLVATDGARGDNLGYSVSLSGDYAVIGADYKSSYAGAAYFFTGLDASIPIIAEHSRLYASNNEKGDRYGQSVSISNNYALVGAWYSKEGKPLGSHTGSAYLFRLSHASGAAVTENAKLVASDANPDALFGKSVSISGTRALIGASGLPQDANTPNAGAAYLFRNLDTATGTCVQNAKLVASDAAKSNNLGWSISMSGNMGLVGVNAVYANVYLFRNLDTATGTITEDAKLIASNDVFNSGFGISVSLDGARAIVGARLSQYVYLYNDLGTATGSITENAILAPSKADNEFGWAVSLSGDNALVGSLSNNGGNFTGAAYLYLNLNNASGVINEDIRLTAASAKMYDEFGTSVSLDGDRFLIGADRRAGLQDITGTACTGRISTITTLDDGNSNRATDGISFKSSKDWVVGQSSDLNKVTLALGSIADITFAGKAVYIGKTQNSNSNSLIVEGRLVANQVFVGTEEGNLGNTLQVESTGNLAVNRLSLAPMNRILLKGNYDTISALLTYLKTTKLEVLSNGIWVVVSANNYTSHITLSIQSGYTVIEPIQ